MKRKTIYMMSSLLILLISSTMIPASLTGQSLMNKYKQSYYYTAKNLLKQARNNTNTQIATNIPFRSGETMLSFSSSPGNFAALQQTSPSEKTLLQALLIGFFLRPSFNKIIGDGADHFDSRAGLDLGAYMMMPVLIRLEFIREMYLLAALSYISRGATYNLSAENFSYKERIRLSYLSLALFMRASISLGENFPLLTSMYLAAGPRLGLLVGDKTKTTIDGETHTSELGARSTNLGLAFALGALLPYRSGFLDITIQYELGLSKIAESGGPDWRTTALMFSLGYVFSLNQIFNR